MALSILDGNQSATTLSTIVTSGQHIPAHTVVSLGTQAITDMRSAVSGSVVSVSSLPAISGTVTIGQIQGYHHTTAGTNGPFNADVILVGEDIESGKAGGLVVIQAARGGGILGGQTVQGDTPICVYGDNGSAVTISGTVTANSSNGSLTTRFGSVTIANTAFATSAVTNANRKYLLIQNVTTASNAITVGIGFTPTTTQGIQLSSGAVITFEGNYIPTGAVNLLSSVTASCFTILEA